MISVVRGRSRRKARRTGRALWQLGDVRIIDEFIINGSARLVGWFSGVVRHTQSGFLYHYAFVMILGLLSLLGYFVCGWGKYDLSMAYRDRKLAPA